MHCERMAYYRLLCVRAREVVAFTVIPKKTAGTAARLPAYSVKKTQRCAQLAANRARQGS